MPRNILQNAQLFNFHMFGGNVDDDGEEGRHQKHFFVSFHTIISKRFDLEIWEEGDVSVDFSSESLSSSPPPTKNVRICKYVCEEGNVSEEFRFSLLDSLSSIVGDRRTLLLVISKHFRLWIMLLTKAGHGRNWFENKLLLKMKETRNNDGLMILVWLLNIFCQPFLFVPRNWRHAAGMVTREAIPLIDLGWDGSNGGGREVQNEKRF